MKTRNPFLRPFRLGAAMALLAVGGGLANPPAPAPRQSAPMLSRTPSATPVQLPSAAPVISAPVQEDIRDIRPPLHIPYGWRWAAYVAGGIGVAGLALAAWRWYRRRAGQRRKELYELALEQLESARTLMTPEQAYAFSIAISEVVRNYIEQRFQARAAHRTTEEFLHDLLAERHASLAAYRPLLADFLEHCDLAKFARWELSVPQMESMHRSAWAFVVETGRPVPPGPAATAADPAFAAAVFAPAAASTVAHPNP